MTNFVDIHQHQSARTRNQKDREIQNTRPDEDTAVSREFVPTGIIFIQVKPSRLEIQANEYFIAKCKICTSRYFIADNFKMCTVYISTISNKNTL